MLSIQPLSSLVKKDNGNEVQTSLTEELFAR